LLLLYQSTYQLLYYMQFFLFEQAKTTKVQIMNYGCDGLFGIQIEGGCRKKINKSDINEEKEG